MSGFHDANVRVSASRGDRNILWLGADHALGGEREVVRSHLRRELSGDFCAQLRMHALPERAFQVRVHSREWGWHDSLAVFEPMHHNNKPVNSTGKLRRGGS